MDSRACPAKGSQIKLGAPSSWVHAIGVMLVCASLFFLFLQIWGFRDQLLSWQPDITSLLSVCAGIIVYALSCIPLSIAWRHILIALEDRSLSTKKLLLTFAKSQLGKYLPGNVAHLAGRHLLSRDLGYSNGPLVMSIAYEVSGLFSAAGTLCLVFILATDSQLVEMHPSILVIPVLIFASPALLCTHLLVPKFFNRVRVAPPPGTASAIELLVIPYLHYLLFFILAGGSLVLIVMPIDANLDSVSWLSIWVTFSVSWLLGFLTPGAPSGIGIREAVLMYTLAPIIGPAQSIIATVLLRVVTIAGDVAYWAAVEIHFRKSSKA